MIGPLRILRRWRPAANLADELPIVAIPAVMDDDDTDSWGDVLYFRGLLDHITQRCNAETRLRPIPSDMSVALDAALELVRDDGFFAMAVPA